jgi:hypothetical protein
LTEKKVLSHRVRSFIVIKKQQPHVETKRVKPLTDYRSFNRIWIFDPT